MNKTATAKLRYLRMAPRKVRLMASVLSGMAAGEAEAQLMMQPRRAAGPILKLLRSAMANAREAKLDAERLFVKSIRVDGGPMLKRFLPRARGSASPIEKKMSHITVVLEEMEKKAIRKFTFVVAKKERGGEHSHGGRKHAPTIDKEAKEAAPKAEGSKMKRIFRRKSV